MKLLLDQNLSPRLIALLAGAFPGVSHVRAHGLADADDDAVWRYAAANGFTIVSKDSDFHYRSFHLGHPPKVIWVRLGNCTTDDVLDAIVGHADTIRAFIESTEQSILAVS